jgi:predicted subunit of tRNA(5-methylaminomethyl-2-thiouridylate) methyltransferase
MDLYEKLRPYAGACLKVVTEQVQHGEKVMLVDATGAVVLEAYGYNPPLKRVRFAYELVVPEPLVNDATALLFDYAYDLKDTPEVVVEDAAEYTLEDVPKGFVS